MKSVTAIAFDVQPSRWLAMAAAAILIGAIVVPWFSALPLAARLAISLLACVAGVFSLRRFMRPPFSRIAYRASGWTLLDANGSEQAALLRSHTHLAAWLNLDFELDRGRRFRAVLGPDNLDAETRRRLVLLLARAEVVHAA